VLNGKLLLARFWIVAAALCSPRASPLGISSWLNVEAIRLLTHHTSAVIAAIVMFWFVGWLIRKLLYDSVLKRAVLLLDEVVLLCIFAYFAYELLFLLYLRQHGISPS
jgi:hypothetical protein